jgi:hypothetical protein
MEYKDKLGIIGNTVPFWSVDHVTSHTPLKTSQKSCLANQSIVNSYCLSW